MDDLGFNCLSYCIVGGSKASGCPIELTAKEPKYGRDGKFGEVHVLTFSKTSGNTSCLWRFSSAKKNLLNLLFINITAQSTSSGSGCNGNYALIKTHDAESLSSTTFEPYCGERSLPGIRINGTVEIELHDRGHMPGGRGISLAVFVESSSKCKRSDPAIADLHFNHKVFIEISEVQPRPIFSKTVSL